MKLIGPFLSLFTLLLVFGFQAKASVGTALIPRCQLALADRPDVVTEDMAANFENFRKLLDHLRAHEQNRSLLNEARAQFSGLSYYLGAIASYFPWPSPDVTERSNLSATQTVSQLQQRSRALDATMGIETSRVELEYIIQQLKTAKDQRLLEMISRNNEAWVKFEKGLRLALDVQKLTKNIEVIEADITDLSRATNHEASENPVLGVDVVFLQDQVRPKVIESSIKKFRETFTWAVKIYNEMTDLGKNQKSPIPSFAGLEILNRKVELIDQSGLQNDEHDYDVAYWLIRNLSVDDFSKFLAQLEKIRGSLPIALRWVQIFDQTASESLWESSAELVSDIEY